MVVNMQADRVDGRVLKWLFAAGVNWLEQHRQQINNMNVFPVPDGDTGTNMLLTVRQAYKQIHELEEEHIGLVIQAVARGALTGARGNSGTILSMLLRGFAQGLEDKEVMDAQAFAQACQNAVDYAYDTVESVMEPVEGTILTVAREAAAAVQESAQHESNMKTLLTEMLRAAKKSLENTPNLLPKLKEAGVVDSGGMGLVTIIEGMKRLIEGEPVTAEGDIMLSNGTAPADEQPAWQDALVPDDEEGYGYDVQFLMYGADMDVNAVRKAISDMGWSPLIDGDSELIKVHIHVHDPGEPLSYAVQNADTVDDIVVENMQAQYQQYVQDRQQREGAPAEAGASDASITIEGVAVIAVARGEGLSQLFREYGATKIIQGGQTMNPSTEDFLEAIAALPTDDIIILPNNGNIVMAAQQAADASEKNVKVIRSKTVQQGLTGLIFYGDYQDAALDDAYEAIQEGISHVISAEVTTANRTTTIDGVQVTDGDLIGLIDNKLRVAGESIEDVVRQLLDEADADEYGLVTLFYGADIEADEANALAETLEEAYDDLEFEVIAGGQPLYPYLISIE